MKIYTIALRYVVEETFEIEADSREEAIDKMWGESESTWERLRNYKPRVISVREKE
jgi:hypothetical protein